MSARAARWRSRGVPVFGLGLASLGLYGWIGLGGGLASVAAAVGVASPFTAFVILASALFLLYGASVALLWRTDDAPWLLAVLFGLAVLFRMVLVASPPTLSSDMYRYIWDGRVQAHGLAPWTYPPGDPALEPLRDETIYPHINRKGARTIYPPGAQAGFRLIYGLVGDSVTGTKAVMVMADLVTIGLLTLLLAQMGAPLNRALLYAWNPLVIVEVAHSGHLDPLYLPAVVGAFLAHRADRRALVGALVGLATLTKLYPALLVLAFHRRGDRRMPLAWAAVVGLGYLPSLGLGRQVLGFLPTYLFDQYEEFNQGVRFFVRSFMGVGGEPFNAIYLVVACLGLAGLTWLVTRWGDGSEVNAAQRGLLIGGFFLFVVTPALHPWHLLWLLALGTIAPSVTLFVASWALTLSYLKYAQEPGVLPLAVRLVEFLPLLALLAWELVRRRGAAVRWEPQPSAPRALTGIRSPEYSESPS
ncbi:DUF2029 domain-containing protein [Nitrospinae bacterium AH_259_B05_G02_I21]|nr:DUF2029 domain-containing protein [Nitrospinae bacterium AH_259_B05_G02_I21]